PDRSSLLFAQQLLAAGSSPSKQLSRGEIARLVGQALGQLPETDREVLLMRNIDRLSYEEVGCLLDIDAAAARKRSQRSKAFSSLTIKVRCRLASLLRRKVPRRSARAGRFAGTASFAPVEGPARKLS